MTQATKFTIRVWLCGSVCVRLSCKLNPWHTESLQLCILLGSLQYIHFEDRSPDDTTGLGPHRKCDTETQTWDNSRREGSWRGQGSTRRDYSRCRQQNLSVLAPCLSLSLKWKQKKAIISKPPLQIKGGCQFFKSFYEMKRPISIHYVYHDQVFNLTDWGILTVWSVN